MNTQRGKNKHRFLSLLLVLSMMTSYLPQNVLALETTPAQTTEAAAESTETGSSEAAAEPETEAGSSEAAAEPETEAGSSEAAADHNEETEAAESTEAPLSTEESEEDKQGLLTMLGQMLGTMLLGEQNGTETPSTPEVLIDSTAEGYDPKVLVFTIQAAADSAEGSEGKSIIQDGDKFIYSIAQNSEGDQHPAFNGTYTVFDQDGKCVLNGTTTDGTITLTDIQSGYRVAFLPEANVTSYTVTQTKAGAKCTWVKENAVTLTVASTEAGESQQETNKAVFDNREQIDEPVVLTKKWAEDPSRLTDHDNDKFKTHYLQYHVVLQYNSGIKEDSWTDAADLGASHTTPETDTSSLNAWTYTYADLPKTDKAGNALSYRFSEKEESCGEECPVKWSEYIVTYSADGKTAVNTQKVNLDDEKSDYSASIDWKDKTTTADNAAPASRPSVDSDAEKAFVKGITIKRYTNAKGSGEPEKVAVSADAAPYVELTTENDKWTISLKDLPKYDEDGNEYVYYIEQNDDKNNNQYAFHDSEGENPYYYQAEYNNTGAYGIKNTGLYNGGTLTDTRRETESFTFKVDWIDGDNTWYRNSELYLYRFAAADGTDFDTASPVQGFDKMYFKDGILYDGNGNKVDQGEDGSYIWFGDAGENKLDKYAPSGAEYTYYIVQKNVGQGADVDHTTSDYQTTYDDKHEGNAAVKGDSSGKVACIVNAGTIENKLSKTESPSITKTWEAKALQGIIGNLSVNLKLQKRYVYTTSETNTDGTQKPGADKYTTWEDVKDDGGNDVTTVGDGFSSAVMSKDIAFPGQPGYTEDEIKNQTVTDAKGENQETNKTLPAGTKIEYRCLETGVTYTDKDKKTQTVDFAANSTKLVLGNLTDDGTSVVVEQVYNGSSEIVNKLVDQTQVTVKKTWSGLKAGEWPKDAIVVVKVFREDGETVVDNNKEIVTSLVMSEGQQTVTFENLPRYDSEGREIVYYVQEKYDTIIADGVKYVYNDTTYKKETVTIDTNNDKAGDLSIRETQATISNTTPPEGDITINVNKRWLDDGDLTHREAALVGIFKKTDINDGTAFKDDGTLNTDSKYMLGSASLTDSAAWTQKISVAGSRVDQYIKLKDVTESTDVETTYWTTEKTKYPVYVVNNDQDELQKDSDGKQYYWIEDKVELTDSETAYPAYVQKTQTTYSDGGENASTFENAPIYWETDGKTATTTAGDGKSQVTINNNDANGISAPLYNDVKDNSETTKEKNDDGSLNTPIFVRCKKTLSADDYIALEVKVGDNPVKYEQKSGSYSWLTESSTLISKDADGKDDFSKGTEADKQIGDVSTANHLYNVYLGTTTVPGMSGYVIYNQRRGVQEIDISKVWTNGDLPAEQQPQAAYYVVKQWLNDTCIDDDVLGTYDAKKTDKPSSGTITKGEGDVTCIQTNLTVGTTTYPHVLCIANEKADTTGTAKAMTAYVENLPKYDHLGRLLHYTIEEVAVLDPNGVDYRPVSGGIVKVSVKNGTDFVYKEYNENEQVAYYDQYSSSVNLADSTAGGQNTKDVFVYESTNIRSQTFSVSLRKVWRDDGTNQSEVDVRRPDIFFRLYRVPVGTTVGEKIITCEADLLTADPADLIDKKGVVQVGGDYFWNTEHNDWYWTCDTDGVFERYNAEGKEYLYFAVENSMNYKGYVPSYYNGETLPNVKVKDTEQTERAPKNTTEVLDQTEEEDAWTAKLLIVHKEGDGLQSKGTVVNTKQKEFDTTATKVWANLPANFDKSKLPTLYMELSHKLVLDENDNRYGEWETVDVKKGENGVTSYKFSIQQCYDSFGRRYEFDVQERYYIIYGSLDAAAKMELGDTVKVFDKAANGNTLIGEGCYYKESETEFELYTGQTALPSAFYYKKVSYTPYDDRTDSGKTIYVRTAANEYTEYDSLTDAQKEQVQPDQMFAKAEEGFEEMTNESVLLLDHVPGYQSQVHTENDRFTWTNTYDPNASKRQRVEVTVSKTWNYPDYADKLPTQVFQLWRRAEGVSDELVSTDTSTVTTDTSGKTTSTITFKYPDNNKAGSDYLPYFAPNGKPYTYYVKEVVPAGYKAAVAGTTEGTGQQGAADGTAVLQSADIQFNSWTKSGEILVGSNVNTADDTGKVPSYTNTYNGLPVVQKTAEKEWKDESNLYGTRPTDIYVTLMQQGGGNKDDRGVAYSWAYNSGAVNGTWTGKDSGDEWKFAFTNERIKEEEWFKDEDSITKNASNFPKYGPDGSEYSYYVTEQKADSDANNQYDSYTHEADGMNLTNTLPLTSISATKQWEGSCTAKEPTVWTLSEDEISKLYDLGAFPTSITFKLQWLQDNDEWADVPERTTPGTNQTTTRTINFSTADKAAALQQIQNISEKFADLPLYKTGTGTGTENYRRYRVVETMTYPDGRISQRFRMQNQDTGYTTTDSGLQGVSAAATGTITEGGTTTAVNRIDLKKIILNKIWDDENNQDGVRPIAVLYQVTQKIDEKEETTTYKLVEAADGNWTCDAYLPKTDDKETVTEITLVYPNDKKVSVTRDNAAGSSFYGTAADESYKVHNTVIASSDTGTSYSITNTHDVKTLNITSEKIWDDADNVMNSRPGEVKFHLEASTDGKNWSKVTTAKLVEADILPTDNTNGEYIYFRKLAASASKTANGYYKWTGSAYAACDEICTTDAVEQTISADCIKVAADTALDTQYTSIIDGEAHQWTYICTESNGVRTYYKWSTENGTSKYIETTDLTPVWSHLPEKNKTKTVQYRVCETAVAGYFSNSGKQTVDAASEDKNVPITNTTDKTRLVIKKTWDDQNDTYKFRPDSVTYQVEYSHNGTDWYALPDSIGKSLIHNDGITYSSNGNGMFTVSYANGANKDGADIGSKGGTGTFNLPKGDSTQDFYYRVSEVSMTYGTGEKAVTVAANLKKDDSNQVTWKNPTGTGTTSDFTDLKDDDKTLDSEANTIGAYTITKGETKFENNRWISNITNTLETVDVTAVKTWVDDEDRDGIRKKVTFTLHAKAQKWNADSKQWEGDENPNIIPSTMITKELQPAANPAQVKWEKLPKYNKLAVDHTAKENLYTYVVEEYKVGDALLKDSAYTAVYKQPAPEGDNTASVVNFHSAFTFEITPKKEWVDQAAKEWAKNIANSNKGADTDSSRWVGSSYTRPTQVTLGLEYLTKKDGKDTWVSVEHALEVQLPTVTDKSDVLILYGGVYYRLDSTDGKYIPDDTQAVSQIPEVKDDSPEMVIYQGAWYHKETDKYALVAVPTKDTLLEARQKDGSNDADYIFFDGRYYKWENDKYVEDGSGVYTTSAVEQTLSGGTDDKTWSGTTPWKNLPVNHIVAGASQKVSYRVVETAVTGDDAKYLFAKPSETIQGAASGTGYVAGIQKGGAYTAADTAGTDLAVSNKLKQITLTKKDGNGNALSGIRFEIVKGTLAADTNAFTKEQDAEAIIATTGTDGIVTFLGLEGTADSPCTYQITELNTAQGLQLLSQPFYVTIPMSVDVAAYNEAHTDNPITNFEGGAEQTTAGTWDFYQLGYVVTNTANFTMPQSGSAGSWTPGYLGLALIPAAWFMFGRRKRREEEE